MKCKCGEEIDHWEAFCPYCNVRTAPEGEEVEL